MISMNNAYMNIFLTGKIQTWACNKLPIFTPGGQFQWSKVNLYRFIFIQRLEKHILLTFYKCKNVLHYVDFFFY